MKILILLLALFFFSNAIDVRKIDSACMDVPFSVCLGSSKKKPGEPGGPIRLNKDYQQKGLIGVWTFDDVLAQDHTGYHNPVYPKPAFGPGFGSLASGHFNGTVMHYVSRLPPKPTKKVINKKNAGKNNKNKKSSKKDNKKAFKAKPPKTSAAGVLNLKGKNKDKKNKDNVPLLKGDMTVGFWVYLLGDAVGQFRTLLYRGDADTTSPHIQLWPEVRRIHVRVSTGVDPSTHKHTHISMDSHSSILIGRWTHVAFVVQGGRLVQLYVNGVLDTQKLSLQPVELNLPDDRIYLANTPFIPNSGIPAYIDQLTIYSRALSRAELAAIGSVVFPGLDASSIKIGCATCTLDKAIASCKASKGSHLCTVAELNGSGLIVARGMGWVSSMNQHVFASDEKPLEPQNGQPVLGAGLCCRDFN